MCTFAGPLISGFSIIPRIRRVSWWSDRHLLAAGMILLPVAVGIVFLAWARIRVKSTELAITDKRVIAKFG